MIYLDPAGWKVYYLLRALPVRPRYSPPFNPVGDQKISRGERRITLRMTDGVLDSQQPFAGLIFRQPGEF